MFKTHPTIYYVLQVLADGAKLQVGRSIRNKARVRISGPVKPSRANFQRQLVRILILIDCSSVILNPKGFQGDRSMHARYDCQALFPRNMRDFSVVVDRT